MWTDYLTLEVKSTGITKIWLLRIGRNKWWPFYQAGSCLGEAAKLNSGCGKRTSALSNELFLVCGGEEPNLKMLRADSDQGPAFGSP